MVPLLPWGLLTLETKIQFLKAGLSLDMEGFCEAVTDQTNPDDMGSKYTDGFGFMVSTYLPPFISIFIIN